jgi:hypothetical protein
VAFIAAFKVAYAILIFDCLPACGLLFDDTQKKKRIGEILGCPGIQADVYISESRHWFLSVFGWTNYSSNFNAVHMAVPWSGVCRAGWYCC